MQALNLTPNDEEKLLRNFLAVTRIENSTRLCPNLKCQVPIEKNEGCDHMYCIRCKTPFNWSDAQDQTSETKILIENYGNDFDKIQEALERERTGDENGDDPTSFKLPIISKLIVKRTKKCPNMKCKKINIKFSTGNYLICEYCKRGFCFSCGQSVNNPNHHFGHACKRHSDL
jgi:hypothetical protein